MDKETKVENLMGVSIDKIKQMVDVSTVVGDPIPLSDGTTPVSYTHLDVYKRQCRYSPRRPRRCGSRARSVSSCQKPAQAGRW